MFFTTIASASVLYVSAVLAIPQQTPYRNQTSNSTTSPTPSCLANCAIVLPNSVTPVTSYAISSPTSDGSLSPLVPTLTSNSSSSPTLSCSSCTIILPEIRRVFWQSLDINFTTTITAATVIPVVNNKTNTTTTITKYNELPAGYTLPSVFPDSTKVATLTWLDYLANTTVTTVLAYPTQIDEYPYSYWPGCGPDASRVLFPSHPPKPSPQISFPEGGDKFGTNFTAQWHFMPEQDVSFFLAAFPDVKEFKVCSRVTAMAATPTFTTVWETASFLTETVSTSYEQYNTASASTQHSRSRSTPTVAPTVAATSTSPPVSTTPPMMQGGYSNQESSALLSDLLATSYPSAQSVNQVSDSTNTLDTAPGAASSGSASSMTSPTPSCLASCTTDFPLTPTSSPTRSTIEFPITSTLSQSTQPYPVPGCLVSCAVYFPPWEEVDWVSREYNFTTTITAATVITVVNSKKNTTTTTIKSNELPSGYALPETNSDRTRVTTLVRSDYIAQTNFTTVLAYPTVFRDYGYAYGWVGVLRTSTNSVPICATGSYSDVLLPSHPPKPSYPIIFPGGDKFGDDFVARTKRRPEDFDGHFYQSAFPDVQAIQQCWGTPGITKPTTNPASPETSSYTPSTTVVSILTPSMRPPPPLSMRPPPTLPNAYSPAPPPASAQPGFRSVWETAFYLTVTATSYESHDESLVMTNTPGTTWVAPTIANSRSNGNPSAPLPLTPTVYTNSNTGLPTDANYPSNGNPGATLPPPPTISTGGNTRGPPTDANSASNRTPSAPLPPTPKVSTGGNTPGQPSDATSASNGNPSVPVNAATSAAAPMPGVPVLTFSGNTYSANSMSQYIVGDKTLGIAIAGADSTPAPTAALPVLTLGGSTYTANSASQYIIAGETLAIARGAPNPGTIVAVSIPVPALAPPVLTLGGSTYTADARTQYIIAGQTIGINTLGVASNLATTRAPIVLKFDGSTYTANSASEYIIGEQTLGVARLATASTPVPTPARLDLISRGSTYTANSVSQYLIGGETLGIGTLGSASASTPTRITAPLVLTFDGSTYTANSASEYIVGDQTFGITLAAATISAFTPGPPVLTVDGSTYTANSAHQYIVEGQTLAIGSQITIGSGSSATVVRLVRATNGVTAVIFAVSGSMTTSMLSPARVSTLSPRPPIMTVDGSTYTPNAASQYIIEGQTLRIGSLITIGLGSSTTVIELATATNGVTNVIFGVSDRTSTPTLTPARAPGSVPTHVHAPLTFAGHTYTANALTQYPLASGVTLIPGGVVTIDGTRVSLAASGSFVVIGSSTQMLSVAESTITAGVASASGGSVTRTITEGGSPSFAGSTAANTGEGASTGGVRGRSGEMGIAVRRAWLIGLIVIGFLGAV